MTLTFIPGGCAAISIKHKPQAAILIGVLYILGDLAGFASVALVPAFAPGSNVLVGV